MYSIGKVLDNLQFGKRLYPKFELKFSPYAAPELILKDSIATKRVTYDFARIQVGNKEQEAFVPRSRLKFRRSQTDRYIAAQN